MSVQDNNFVTTSQVFAIIAMVVFAAVYLNMTSKPDSPPTESLLYQILLKCLGKRIILMSVIKLETDRLIDTRYVNGALRIPNS
jgi:hypothetical protein